MQPAEEFISYNATTKRVELDFSKHLRGFQRFAGFVAVFLSLTFLFLAWGFYHLSNKVIDCIKTEAKNCVDEKTRQLELKRLFSSPRGHYHRSPFTAY